MLDSQRSSPSSAAMITSDSFQPPLQLKGEIMDLEFTLDTDHRKRRRNRTTQSCLNCHTSKRKCDRKRPCQRCIQLGLTGLCVYEIDDPALRDDPTVDENTRLRNRIAELESLVRELRGKPHPRWAESNFRDGDPNEKWHSRATKSGSTVKRRGHSPDGPDDQVHENDRGGGIVSLLAPIKTEAASEVNHPNLYRFSPSPAPSMRYHIFQADARSSPASSYDNEQQCQSYGGGPHSSGGGSSISFHSSPSLPPIQYNGTSNSARSPFQNSAGSGGSYAFDRCDEDATYVEQYASDMSPRPSSFCPCRTSLATGHVFIALNQQLQNTVNSLRQYNQHPPNSQCVLYRRIVELHSLIQLGGGDSADGSLGTYDDDISTPTDSDIMTPLSASNSFHAASSGGAPSQEWQAMAASYSSYFHVHPPQPPPPHGDGQHGIYNVGS